MTALLAGAVSLVLLAVLAAPAHAETDCQPNNAPYGTQTFSYTGAEQTWVVPPGVHWIKALVYAGQGGTNGHFSGSGGQAGAVSATVPVTPGWCLVIYVGGYGAGHGGWGFGHGGDHGYITGSGSGSSGGGGGGSSAVLTGSTIVVAGAGGGGGGDSANNHPGGAGGSGGPPPVPAGSNGANEGGTGGAGGCGGCVGRVDGTAGQNTGGFFGSAGAGGGGGSGWNGGAGGNHGASHVFGGGTGGGGGGAGQSYAGSGVGDVTYFSSSSQDGQVIITWPASPPADAATAAAATPVGSKGRELPVSRTGTVRLPIRCTRRSGRCTGTARVHATSAGRRVLAQARYSVRAGHQAQVTAPLTAAGRAALQRSPVVPARLRAGTGAAAPGNGAVVLLGRRAPAATVATTRTAAGADGQVRVRVSCPKTATTGCNGRLRLEVSGGGARSNSAPFRIRAGRTANVAVRLTRQARRGLARNRRLDLLAVTTTGHPVGAKTRRAHDLQVTQAGEDRREPGPR